MPYSTPKIDYHFFDTFSVGLGLYMSLHGFHLGQIISTVLGQVEHGGQDGNAARTRISRPNVRN